ncbi:MAG: tRNA (guanine(46)-N(7))-methyltransferase TrmB [Pseudomonadota bacterium]
MRSNRPIPTPDRPNFYGRRGTRPLKPSRKALVDEMLPNIRIDYPETGNVDPVGYFAVRPQQMWLEIGFGGGEHLAGQAEAHPDVGFIGCEPFMDGVGSLLRHIDERGLVNVRVVPDDSRPLLYKLTDACFDRAFLLFPDPWPKTRHAERRFIGPKNLALMARLLKDGAEFRVASDDMQYISWTLQHLHNHPDFEWLADAAGDWRNPPSDWIKTRYEQKALRQGKKCSYLRFRRRARIEG